MLIAKYTNYMHAKENPKRTYQEICESLKINGWKETGHFAAVYQSGDLVKVVFVDGTTAEGRME